MSKKVVDSSSRSLTQNDLISLSEEKQVCERLILIGSLIVKPSTLIMNVDRRVNGR